MKNRTINGFRIYAFKNKKNFLNEIKNKKKILIAMNAEKILKKNKILKDIVNENIGYPDGIGAVMALKQRKLESVKIPGVELWLDLIMEFHKTKKFYFIGSSKDVIEATVEKLKKHYPNLDIVGFREGYLDIGEKEKLIDDLKIKNPDVVFVAQGSPRQEYLMHDLFIEYNALYMGLGGSFDIYSARKKRAPALFLKYNIEWLYRLLKEPTRISRQLILVKFLFLLLIRKI
jgi:UDP-N-acetyl-D-mannosaminouronate:lipid I N-acetyl-D-mannosaminouronosyltransferase